MKKLILLAAITLISGFAQAQTTDLFISEYVEGSGNNKAVEIFNGSGEAINLGEYSLLLYANGASTATQTMPLNAVDLDTGETLVLVNSNAAAAELLAYADQLTGSLAFNGDDTLVLVKGTQVMDCIGTVGFDPGDSWSCADGITANTTMRRKGEVCNGIPSDNDAFNACMEWKFYIVDSFDGLGRHSTDCTAVNNDSGSWGSLKADYR